MTTSDTLINEVSDTALWVAHYRALETAKPDGLFRDPLAKILAGERGQAIAEDMKSVGRYTASSVIIRTVIIDGFIQSLIKEGADAVVNLGAGMDTRPYRMGLSKDFQWIEVDHPHVIDYKNEKLKNESPVCVLTREAVDLSEDRQRKDFFAQIDSRFKKAIFLTEGVMPYLNEGQVSSLAKDLHQIKGCAFWITEYFSREVYRHLKRSLRTRKMRNAPFQFYPENWLGFFEQRGWIPQTIKYIGEESLNLGREIPMPWFVSILNLFFKEAILEKSKRMTGYMILRNNLEQN